MLTNTAENRSQLTAKSSINSYEIASELATGYLPEQFRAEVGLETRFLAQTRSLALLPTVSPLCVGHVLLFAKDDHLSMGELLRCRGSIESEIGKMAALYKDRFGPPLLFEHGSVEGGTVACGVTRAHLHLIPRSQIKFDGLCTAIDSEIGTGVNQPFVGLKKIHSEYIFISKDLEAIGRVWQGEQLPSQMVRRHIARELSLSEWNWRALFGWDVLRATIAEWARAGVSHASTD
jgi:diadenosine tetraphosphate (Ap4A) HIT family hydrolase